MPPFSPTLLLLTLLLSISTLHSSSSNPTSCENRWIYIRPLPPRFNLDLLENCSNYPLFLNLCPLLANHGLGPKTHNLSHSWFRSHPSTLELLFHRRLLLHPCLTPDPSAASAVFLPYYSSLDALPYLFGPKLNLSSQHGLHLFHYLQKHQPHIWNRHMGHDHFLIMARPAWDFSQSLDATANANEIANLDGGAGGDVPLWGTSFLELPEFYNVTALTLEARPWPWQEHAVPYPTSFHPPSLELLENWIRRVRLSKRTVLAVFAGGGGTSSTPNIRRSIRMECEGNGTMEVDYYERGCEIVDCSNGVCELDPLRYMRPMLGASFCLQPPGDTPTRRATFDGILAGCIPVFFEDQSAKSQYGWHLPEEEYESFSVFIPKEDVVFKGVRILDVLRGISRGKVRRMRERILEIIPRIMYRSHNSSPGLKAKKDAFDIAIEGALQKIQTRLQELNLAL